MINKLTTVRQNVAYEKTVAVIICDFQNPQLFVCVWCANERPLQVVENVFKYFSRSTQLASIITVGHFVLYFYKQRKDI